MKGAIKNSSLDTETFHAEEICFWSDQEKAMVNAIESVFPGGKRKICYLHLKENLVHYMRV